MGETLVLGDAADSQDDLSAWTPIDDNTTLLAKLIELKRVTKNFKDKETGEPVEKMMFVFQVSDPNSTFGGRRVRGETSVNFVDHERCKLYTWIQALMGQKLPAGFKINTDDILGAEVEIVVGKKTAPRLDGNGDWYDNYVKTIRRPSSGVVASSSSNFYEEEPF